MLDALVAGTTDPTVLVELAKGWLRPKIDALQEALSGCFDDHHALLVAEMLAHINYLEGSVARLDAAIANECKPFQHVLELLDTIPGIKERGGQVVLAEMGADMSRFPTAGRLASWVVPGQQRVGRQAQGGHALREPCDPASLWDTSPIRSVVPF